MTSNSTGVEAATWHNLAALILVARGMVMPAGPVDGYVLSVKGRIATGGSRPYTFSPQLLTALQRLTDRQLIVSDQRRRFTNVTTPGYQALRQELPDAAMAALGDVTVADVLYEQPSTWRTW